MGRPARVTRALRAEEIETIRGYARRYVEHRKDDMEP